MGRHYNLPHQLSQIHPKFKTPFIATITSGIIMIVMACSLPLTDITQLAGVIFLLLFTQVNISVITIRRIYGDKLDYGFEDALLSNYSNHRDIFKGRACNLSIIYSANQLGYQRTLDFDRLWNISALYFQKRNRTLRTNRYQ